jgi:hypothetical protein
MFVSLSEFLTKREPKSVVALEHPADTESHFGSRFLAMSSRYDVVRDHIANFLIFLSNTQSFWFTLDTSYNHGCYLANRFCLDPEDYKVVSPLVAPPWCCFVMPAGCRIASWLVVPSLRRPLVVLLRQLVVASPLVVLSLRCPLVVLRRQLVVALPLIVLSLCHPLVNSLLQRVVASPLIVLLLRPAPPSHPLVAPAGCCVASRRAALSSSRRLVVPPLVVSSCQLAVVPSSLAILSLHRPLVLSSCWMVVALPVHAPPPSRPLVVVHRPRHRTPSNAAAATEHHRHRRH